MPGDRVGTLVSILAAHPGGLSTAELFATLRQQWPYLTEAQAGSIVEAAGDLVEVVGRTVRLRALPAEVSPADAPEPHEGVRVVAFDCETAVRLVATAPYTEARIFQIGAVRLGTDAAWVAEAPQFVRFVELEEGFEVFDPQVAARHAAESRPPAEVLGAFCDFVASADYLVAYNAEVADFSFIDEAADRAHLERIEGPARVDALYLGLCFYPYASGSHRLFDLAARAGVELAEATWHDALDDSRVLARLLEALGQEVAAKGPGLVALLSALGATSAPWQMLFALGGLPAPQPVALETGDVTPVVLGHLGATAPLRARGRARVGGVPTALRGTEGIDPHLVASAARGGAELRASQDEMAKVLRRWISDGTDGLCEAPTGIGKSYVTLSTALEWLESHPSGRVVIATHTKQLQRQLAAEIEKLAHGELAWLRPASGLVKGAVNRLSLRSLVRTIADCTEELAASPRPAQGTLFSEPRFCELVAYLLLRLCTAPSNLADEWESRSVDPMDVAPFFEPYTEGSLPRWLRLLSQAEAGDYGAPPTPGAGVPAPVVGGGGDGSAPSAPAATEPDPGAEPSASSSSSEPPHDPLELHTEFAPEAVARHRLVVTNHALLMAHREHIGDNQTLLIVDEAHAIESTATEALSLHIDYLSVELLAREALRCGRELAGVIDVTGLLSAADDLDAALHSEVLPTTVSRIFDTVLGPKTRGNANRAATLVSRWGGDQARRDVMRAVSEVRALHQKSAYLIRMVMAVLNSAPFAQVEPAAAERFAALGDRAMAVEEATGAICDVADALFGPPSARASAPVAPPVGGDGNVGSDTDADDDDDSITVVDDEDVDGDNPDVDNLDVDNADGDEVDGDLPLVPAPAANAPRPVANRIVWANENESPDLVRGMGMRHYRFALHTSPVELPLEANWMALRPSFARSVWISATLSVAPGPQYSGFEFIRSRLGFGTDVAEHRLPASFDYAHNARLYVMSDFPSWSEHETQAIRTLSWQVAGFCSEVTAPVGERTADGPAPYGGGAMVITTATSSAAAIADRLDADLAARGAHVPVHAAVLRGNQRAVSEFQERGGVLVGTKGLWAGVDVADPQRLRLLWINKLPFAPFADPLVQARIAACAERATRAGEDDPDAWAQRHYYLPLAALELRQGIGRLIRSDVHRGVIVISDRRLSGVDRLRRTYRDVFLGSLDPGLLVADGADPAGGNVVNMNEAWEGIWRFMADVESLAPARVAELCEPEALLAHTVTPELRQIKRLEFSVQEYADLLAESEEGAVAEVLRRCTEVARLLSGNAELTLRPEQADAIAAVVTGRDLLALLPTGFGKSYCFQLPALVLPGVTVVVSPLVALMAEQAMELNRTVAGAVRALVAPLRDSSSRAGKAEVAAALAGTRDTGIKLVYVSPERAAQRAFREALYAGAERGSLAALAIDEAHTVVQWGEDFRPSFRRLTPVLAEIRTRAHRADRPLPISAFTATADPSVRDGLLRLLFAQEEPAAPPPPEVVSANPIRPELAIYSRKLRRGGDVAIAGIAEAVANACPGHLIIYCLTVNEVQSTYAQLRDWIGPEREWQVRRFHGRLSSAEKTAVLDAFKYAPKDPDDPAYYRMIVVATSAFGLGIDRGDVAAVLSLSPPSDMASLYQQLGRGGRDLAQGAGGGEQGAVGMALAHRRGWRMVEFLTTTDLDLGVLCDLGRRVLACGGLLDPKVVADAAIDDAVAAGTMSVDVARLSRTRDDYRAGVVRAMATLAGLGAVEDLGDIPAFVKVMEGPTAPDDPEDQVFVDLVLEGVRTIASTGARAGGAQGAAQVTCALPLLHSWLAFADMVEDGEGPAETWVRLYDAHGAGWLDVSQFAPNQSFVTALEIRTHELPEGFTAAMGGRRTRAMGEIQRLKDWFDAEDHCAQVGFAEYFGETPPAEVCATAPCRCSRCWQDRTGGADPAPEPALYGAFWHHNPAPVTAADDARRLMRLRRQVKEVLRLKYRGVAFSQLLALFQGSDTIWSSRAGRSFRVHSWIPNHVHFGSHRGWVNAKKLRDVLDELVQDGEVVLDGRSWRLAQYAQAPAANAQAAIGSGAGS